MSFRRGCHIEEDYDCADGIVASVPGSGIASNPKSACNRRNVMVIALFYRSALGFAGYDRFAAEIIDAQGVARVRHFTVEVR